MKVPLFELTTQHGAMETELRAAFERVFASGFYILGPEVSGLEEEVCAATGSPHALGVSSGTDALLLALMAAGIGPGDEVLVPAFTFFATAGCVARVGATPVWVDACPVCYNLYTTDAAAKVTAKTKAIIPVHLFGQAAEMDAVMALAAEHDLIVIEDAAQSLGAHYKGKPLGTIGHFGVASFFPTKNLGALGDAGMLLVREEAHFEQARILRVHGMEPKYYHREVGGNFRLDAMQAAFLRVKLPHLDALAAARRDNAEDYTQQLSALPGVVRGDADACACFNTNDDASTEARIILPVAYPHVTHIWNQYTLRVRGEGQRDALRTHLAECEIGSEVYYPLSLHEQACFAGVGQGGDNLTVASQLASEVLSIPIYPELSAPQRAAVVTAIASFLAETA